MRREFSIDGHKLVALSYNEDKDTVPVICIHGIVINVDFWEPVQTPLIARRFTWHSVSLPGHFPAVMPPQVRGQRFGSEQVVFLFEKLIRELAGDRKVILLGHSTGACMALDIAARLPHLCAGLICVSGVTHGHWAGPLGAFKLVAQGGRPGTAMFNAWFRWFLKNRVLFPLSLGFCAADVVRFFSLPEYKAVRDISFPAIQQMDPSSILTYFRNMPYLDLRPVLKNITAPSLVVCGQNDPLVPVSQSRLIAEHIPQSQLRFVPAAGHLPMVEQPQEYHRIIEEWLGQFVTKKA